MPAPQTSRSKLSLKVRTLKASRDSLPSACLLSVPSVILSHKYVCAWSLSFWFAGFWCLSTWVGAQLRLSMPNHLLNTALRRAYTQRMT